MDPTPDPTPRAEVDWDLPTVTLSVIEAPVSMLLLELADQLGVSVVVPPDRSADLVTLDLRQTPGQQAIHTLASVLGMSPKFDGYTVSLVELTDTAESFTVFRVGHADVQQISDAVRTVAGAGAVVSTFEDRVVVAGSADQVRRANELARDFLVGPDGWRLEVRVVSISESLRQQIGFDWDLSAQADASAGFRGGDLVQPVLTGVAASVVVRVLAEATQTTTEAYVENSATLYVLEGGTATMNQGDRVPIPKFQTSPEGTTTVVGFEYLETGFSLTAGARRVPGGVRLEIEPVVSSVTGFVEQAPITTESRVKVDTVIEDGEWLIVSGLDANQGSVTDKRIPGTKSRAFGHTETTRSDGTLLVLLRADRVYASGGKPGA